MSSSLILHRLYQDFLMGSRFATLERLLRSATDGGYRIVSVADWADLVEREETSSQRLLVLRHDIDTDPATGLAMAEIERDAGAGASFFFRLSTFDPAVVARTRSMGFHVSYHFEELASHSKARGLVTVAAVNAELPVIQQTFAENLLRLRDRFGLPLDIVCSHGDWKNRQLRLSNHALLNDAGLRQQLKIRYETYDPALAAPLAGRFADAALPDIWSPADPFAAIAAGHSPLYLLLHPRQWRSSLTANARETTVRIREAIQARLKRAAQQ